ncbi:hypothetical protein [Hungatella effluvii]|uniref:hypothetical protein n=1 Tax=Hungatella effluvii TaxID=1096246 RepID=UPI002A81577D|nr:hypothetical protein [Hungatella effluvii]
MTRFERDLKDAKEGNGIEVMKRRKAEIEKLEKAGRCEKNGFKRTCIAQELTRLKAEYSKLDELF